jgi:hypothetical protein
MAHGVLCPANWATGAPTVSDGYDERFARMREEFEDAGVELTDLDAKHGTGTTSGSGISRSMSDSGTRRGSREVVGERH